jgi:hypothetical protein
LLGEDLTPEQLAAAEQHRRERLRLEREFVRPLVCQTAGRALVQPLVTRDEPGAEYVAWPTDLGYLNIAWIDIQEEGRLVVKYRLETAAAITARPAYLPPDPNNPADPGTIFATSRDGFVHGIGERSGESLWRFSTGEPILEPAVVIGRRVYVATQFGGM